MALYIVSTPIGNLEDISLRALKVLFSVPVILCEDTRRTGNLLEWFRKSDLIPLLFKEGKGVVERNQADSFLHNQAKEMQSDIDSRLLRHAQDKLRGNDKEEVRNIEGKKPRLVSFFEHNEGRRISEVIELLKQGSDVALVTNAGTPVVSDPGFKLVREALKHKIRVVSIPGACAWLCALTSSGMPADRVLFLGYLSPREVRRLKELHQLKDALGQLRKSPTLVMYEAPHRLVATLRSILEVAGNVEVVLAKELTKLHEKVEKRSASLWIAEFGKSKSIRGEFTLVWRFEKGDSQDLT